MHSSRMCTARLLIVSQHALLGGVSAWGVPAQEGVPAKGVPAQVLPPVNRMTDRYKNITLPQTSFAGGKYSSKIHKIDRAQRRNTSYNITLGRYHNEILIMTMYELDFNDKLRINFYDDSLSKTQPSSPLWVSSLLISSLGSNFLNWNLS